MKQYYHISHKILEDITLYPRIPEHGMEQEDCRTKRVCFSTSLAGCFKGVGEWPCNNREFYVYEPVNYTGIILCPDEKQVPDVRCTREKWFIEPVTVRCIGRVRFYEDKKRNYGSLISYKFGFDKLVKFKWLEKF